jgi:hypothetical protein
MLKDVCQVSGSTENLITVFPLDLNLGKSDVHIGHSLIWVKRLVLLFIDIHDGKSGLISFKRNNSNQLLVVEILMRINGILSHSDWVVHVNLLAYSVTDTQRVDSSDFLLKLLWNNNNIIFVYFRDFNVKSVLVVVGVVFGIMRDELFGDFVLMRNHRIEEIDQFLG